MVKIVDGNLLDATEHLICHQVNCQGVMGSGVAKAVKEKWPEVHEAYVDACNRYHARKTSALGYAQFVPTADGAHEVVNMFAQNTYGYDGMRYTSYDAFYSCLVAIQRTVERDISIAFPYRVGSDRGGASWSVIYTMICDVLGDRDVTIYRLEE